MADMSRRQFASGALGVAMAGSALNGAPLLAATRASAGTAPVERYNLAATSWNFYRSLFSGERKASDIPALLKAMGIDRIEWTAKTLRPLRPDPEVLYRAPDAAFFRELRSASDDAGVSSEVLNVGGPFVLATEDSGRLSKALDFVESYVEGAQLLGCRVLRTELYTDVPDGPDRFAISRDRAVEGLGKLLQRLAGSGLILNVENHHGVSSRPEWLAAVIRGVNDRRLGLTVDTNNFRVDMDMPYEQAADRDTIPRYIDRYPAIRMLMPFANWVSAKTYAFDHAGWEISMDYPQIMQIIVDSGYRGTISIEYEGQGDPAQEVARSADMFRRLFRHFP